MKGGPFPATAWAEGASLTAPLPLAQGGLDTTWLYRRAQHTVPRPC
jgi:hypothetical protein